LIDINDVFAEDLFAVFKVFEDPSGGLLYESKDPIIVIDGVGLVVNDICRLVKEVKAS